MHPTRLAILLLVPIFAAGRPAAAADELATLETPLGNLTIRLLRDRAPRHVDNFEKLALSGFYEGTTFHRVIPGFIVQGGSPTSKDSDPRNDNFGTPGYAIKPEFSDIPFDRGVVAMARNPDEPDTAGSQFFIVLGRAPQLDSKYTVFARVVEGMDVADRIASAARDEDNYDRPFEPVVVKKVRLNGPESAAVATATPAAATPAAATPVAATARLTPAPIASPPAVTAAAPPASAGADGGRVRVAQDFVNIREGPSADRPVLQKLRKGTELKVQGRQGDWLEVPLASGKTGYVRKDMVEPVDLR